MTTAGRDLVLILASESGSPEVRGATILFVAVTLLLGIFLTVVALAIASRRRRQRSRSEPEGEEVIGDAWTEAGRRAHPFDEGSEDDG